MPQPNNGDGDVWRLRVLAQPSAKYGKEFLPFAVFSAVVVLSLSLSTFLHSVRSLSLSLDYYFIHTRKINFIYQNLSLAEFLIYFICFFYSSFTSLYIFANVSWHTLLPFWFLYLFFCAADDVAVHRHIHVLTQICSVWYSIYYHTHSIEIVRCLLSATALCRHSIWG